MAFDWLIDALTHVHYIKMSESGCGSNSTGGILKPSIFEWFVIPSKKTIDVDWQSQLKSCLMEVGEDPSTYSAEVASFNRMRQDARGAIGNTTGIELIAAYYRQLDSLFKRLPKEHKPTIKFSWYDAFDTHSHVEQVSIPFEKANVLFNLAAVMSQASRISEPARNFQHAAAVLSFIESNFLNPPLMDIQQPALRFFTAMMMAQAQEAIIFEAFRKDKSLVTICKLTASVAQLAQDAYRLLCLPELSDLRSCLISGNFENDHDPLSLVQVKASCWYVLAEYLHAELAMTKGQIGEALGRLSISLDTLKMSLETSSYDTDSQIITYFSSLLTHLKNRRAQLEKENSLIYSQRILQSTDLPPLEGISMVTMKPLSEILQLCCGNRPELFKKLVPLEVHEEMSRYSEEKAKLLRLMANKASTADTEFQTTLTALGFPAALDDLENNSSKSTGLPEELKRPRQQALSMKLQRPEFIDDQLQEMAVLLGKISENLDDEIAIYQKRRVEHGAQWTQAASHIGNSKLFEELYELQQLLRHASSRRNLVPCASNTDFAMLTGSEDGIIKLLPVEDPIKEKNRAEYVAEIRRMLDQLEQFAKDRLVFLDKLREAVLSDDISEAFTAKPRNQDTMEFFHQQLSRFDDHCSAIETNIAQQNDLLRRFKALWEDAKAISSSSEDEKMKRELVQRMSYAIAEQTRIQDGINELLKEIDLIRTRSRSLSLRVTRFVEQREQEGKDIREKMQLSNAQKGQEYLLGKLGNLTVKDRAKTVDISNSKAPPAPEGNIRIESGEKVDPYQSLRAKLRTKSLCNEDNHPDEPSLLD